MKLDEDRWSRLDSILDRAFDLPAEERLAFLEVECAGDPDLLFHASALIRADEEAADFLDATTGGYPARDETPRAQVGPFRLAREIGRGGMGVVYLAERCDGQFEQTVALKIVRRERTSGRVLRRFIAERQVLARLDHPNITRLVDGGITVDGVPWFAMEHVDGTPIDRFVRDRALPLEERVALFEQVCSAVAYAQRSLVVHRDLKPSNVLVTQEGNAKLLDFGIAKILDDGGESPDGEITLEGASPLTPHYAAPEQIRGEPVTTATDVYALGLILYESLSGSRPRSLAGLSVGEILDRLQETPPARMPQNVPRDLAAIVSKSIEISPDRRYTSAADLLDDLQRYRASLPVRARPGSQLDAIRRFVRRHRVAVIGAVVVGLTALGGVAGILWQARDARRQAERATLQTKKAERTLEFFTTMLGSTDPALTKGKELSVRESLTRTAAALDTSLVDEPEVRATIQHALGSILSKLGDYPEAMEQLERALATRSSVQGEFHPETFETLYELAVTQLQNERVDEAEVTIARANRASQGLHEDVKQKMLELYALTAVSLDTRGEFAAAESTFLSVIASADTSSEGSELRAFLWTNFSNVYGHQARYEDAVQTLKQAIDVYTAMGGLDSPNGLGARFNLGARLGNLERYDESIPILREVAEDQRRIFGPEHFYTLRALSALGYHLSESGQPTEGEAILREAMQSTRTSLGSDHPAVAVALQAHALTLRTLNRHAEAEVEIREALRISRGRYGERHVLSAALMVNLAHAVSAQGRREEALGLLRRALAIRLELLDANHPEVVQNRESIATLERGEPLE